MDFSYYLYRHMFTHTHTHFDHTFLCVYTHAHLQTWMSDMTWQVVEVHTHTHQHTHMRHIIHTRQWWHMRWHTVTSHWHIHLLYILYHCGCTVAHYDRHAGDTHTLHIVGWLHIDHSVILWGHTHITHT